MPAQNAKRPPHMRPFTITPRSHDDAVTGTGGSISARRSDSTLYSGRNGDLVPFLLLRLFRRYRPLEEREGRLRVAGVAL